MNAIIRFDGKNKFLSNFWMSEVEYDGIKYRSSEHAYQSAKTLDPYKNRISNIPSNPGLVYEEWTGLGDWLGQNNS